MKNGTWRKSRTLHMKVALSVPHTEKIEKFMFAKKVIRQKENGLIEYSGGYFGRVIKVGQKNFGIEDVVQQNIDIDYLANALKMLDGTQCADIIKIDRPVNLDNFAQDLFGRLAEMKESVDGEEVREIKTAILRERIDRIDKMNWTSR